MSTEQPISITLKNDHVIRVTAVPDPIWSDETVYEGPDGVSRIRTLLTYNNSKGEPQALVWADRLKIVSATS